MILLSYKIEHVKTNWVKILLFIEKYNIHILESILSDYLLTTYVLFKIFTIKASI